MKFAAIDIGSNAMRLLFVNVYETKSGPVFHKDELVRIPIRLGEDSFLTGRISDQKIEKVIKAMSIMRMLIELHNANAYKACATSAMRDAENSAEVIDLVRERTGIEIELLTGEEEASVIMQYPLEDAGIDPMGAYLYIDVGGGSTEFALIEGGKLVDKKSMNIGTIRLLNDQVQDSDWKEIMKWLQEVKKKYPGLFAIGVGGNINKTMKMYGRQGKPFLTLPTLRKVLAYIDGLSMAERVRDLGLKPDRADVLVPALRIYINSLKWAGIDKIYVPKKGLSDGIVKLLYSSYKNA